MLEWTDPPFTAGHWVPDMVVTAGATCVLGDSGQKSRRIDWDELTAPRPEMIVVAPCGYGLGGATDLAATLRRSGRLPADASLWAVDADAAFVRPGPRLVDGVETLAAIATPTPSRARPDLATPRIARDDVRSRGHALEPDEARACSISPM